MFWQVSETHFPAIYTPRPSSFHILTLHFPFNLLALFNSVRVQSRHGAKLIQTSIFFVCTVTLCGIQVIKSQIKICINLECDTYLGYTDVSVCERKRGRYYSK